MLRTSAAARSGVRQGGVSIIKARVPNGRNSRAPLPLCRAKPDEVGAPTRDTGVALKGVWFAAEQFGKMIGGNTQSAVEAPSRKMTREEMLAEIKADYDTNYFISGEGGMAAYAPNCVFSDPFVSFAGTERFKQNVGNLGALLTDVKLDVYDIRESETEVTCAWRFSGILSLPWRPLLAAGGNTTHVFDLERGCVVQHIERWDADPGQVIKRLLKPASKVPTSYWEIFFLAASSGDIKGLWALNTPNLIKISAPVALGGLVLKLASGDDLPLHLGEVALFLMVSGALTEVLKLAGSF